MNVKIDHFKLIIKSVIWRILSVLMTSAVAYFVTGDIKASMTIGLVDTFFKIFTYYGFDVFWVKLTRKKNTCPHCSNKDKG